MINKKVEKGEKRREKGEIKIRKKKDKEIKDTR